MQHQFEVKGMTCGHCEMAVKKAVMRLDPSAQIDIVRQENKVSVQSDKARDDVAKAIADEGYAVA